MTGHRKRSFESAIMADKLLKRGTRDVMWTSLRTTDGEETGYGLGWGVMDKFGLHLLAHTGGSREPAPLSQSSPAATQALWCSANLDDVDVNQLAMQILHIALECSRQHTIEPDFTPGLARPYGQFA